MRESASLDLLPRLQQAGARLHAFDPSSPREAARLLPGVVMETSALDAATDADVLIVLADWKVFRTYDLGGLASAMRRAVMIDLRNLFNREAVLDAGFERYHGLGVKMGVRKRSGRAGPRLAEPAYLQRP